MSVAITMPSQAGGQEGYCGNFNGDPEDDFKPVSPSFHMPVGSHLGPVNSSMVLFDTSSWGIWIPDPNDNSTWLDPSSVISSCNSDLKELAIARCRRITDVRMRNDCITDVCATGLESVADGIMAAEIIGLKVTARGIPLFMGYGQCLDSAGKTYIGFSTKLTSVPECTDILRSLALIRGVIGAQFQEGQMCQVLVTDKTDPTEIQIKGGWGPKINDHSHGNGLISSTSEESDWKCWLLV